MTKRYVEATIAYEDDPAINPAGNLEVSSREKEGEAGTWTDSIEGTNCVPRLWLNYPWLQLEVKKV